MILVLQKALYLVSIIQLVGVLAIDYCQQLASDQLNCVKCIDGFQLFNNPQNYQTECQSKCLDFLQYSFKTLRCSSSCDQNQIGNKLYKVCEDINPCPILNDVGQDYHTGSVTSLIIDSRTQGQSNTQLPGQILLTISDSDNTIKLWSMSSGELKSTFVGHTSPIVKLYLLEAQNQLISFSMNGEIITWDYLTGQIIQKQQITIGQLTSMSAIDIKQTLVTFFGFQGEFFIYNFSAKTSYKFIGHSNIVKQALFYQTNQIITSSLDKQIILWNISGSSIIYNIICGSAPAGLIILSFQINLQSVIKNYDYILSFGSESTDALKIQIIDINNYQMNEQKVFLEGHQSPIVGIIADPSSYSFISFSTQEVFVFGFSQKDNSFTQLQSIQSTFFITNLFTPIKGAYLNYIFLVLYSETGKFMVMTYMNGNANPSISGTPQTIIQTQQAQPVQLARKDIRGIQLDLQYGLLYIFGEQILQINLQQFKVNFVINNIMKPFVKHTQKVTQLDYNEDQKLVASCSLDGLAMTYDFITGKIVQIFFHPDYINKNDQPQGIQVALIKGIAMCVAYSDKTVICYHAVNSMIIYRFELTQSVLTLYKDDVNGLLIANTIDQLLILSPFQQKIVNQISQTGQFYYIKFYSNFVLMTSSINGNQIRFNYPDLTEKYSGSPGNLNTDSETFIGLAFGNEMEGLSVSYFSKGLVIIYNQDLTIFNSFQENTKINRCGLVQNVMISCMTQDGRIISHGINSAFYFEKKLFDFPLTYSDLLVKYNKAMFLIDFGQFGGSLVFCDVTTNLAESQFLSPASISKFEIDEIRQRVLIANAQGDIMVSHFNPYTYSQLQRQEQTFLNKVYLLQSEQKIIILSNIITIYDYFENQIINTNQNHSINQKVKGVFIEESIQILISFNDDTSNNLQVWNYETDTFKMLNGHTKGVNGVQFIVAEKIIITYGQDGLILTWQFSQNLNNIANLLQIKSHETKNIVNLSIFNKYNQFIVSFDSTGILYITNYIDGSIQKALSAPLMKNMVIDEIYDRIFLYGTNIVIYNAVTGTKIIDLLNFDGTVQAVLFKGDYIIAYGSLSIQSIQRSTLKFLYSGKFKKAIYMLSLLKNLAGMVGNNYDNSIEIWDYTTGVMNQDIKNIHYPSNVIGIYQDEESELFVVINIKNELYTVTPFTNSFYQVKDFLLSPMTSSYIKEMIIDNISNKLIVYNDDSIIVWNYYTYLGLQGQAFLLPSESLIMSVYNKQKDVILYADLERNIWQMKNDILTYKKQLSYTPIQLTCLGNTYIASDGSNLYSYDIDLNQVSKLNIFPYQIYVNSENEKIPFIFVQSYDYSIIQVYLDANSSTLTAMFQYKDHTQRIISCIFNNYYQHFITYDITGKLVINNFMTNKNVLTSTENTNIIRDIQYDIVNQRLIVCSEDQTVKVYTYEAGDVKPTLLSTLNYNVQVVQSLIDSDRKQVLIWSDLQQIIEVRDLSDANLKIIKKLKTPGDYMVKMRYSKQYDTLVIFNPFQVNFYDRSQNDLFINSLREPSTFTDINDIRFLSKSLILIHARSSLRLIRLTSSDIITEKIFNAYFPYILSLEYENSLILRLKGVNLNNVFNYTFPFADDQSKQHYSVCYQNFQRTSSYFQLSQDLEVQDNSFKKLQQSISRIVLNIEMEDSQNFFFVKNSNQQQDSNSNVERLYVYNKKSINDQARIKLSFDSFLDFNMVTLMLKDFEWKITNSRKYTFNAATQNVIFVNSLFQDDIINNYFVFDKLETFQFDKMTIQNLSILQDPSSKRNLEQYNPQQQFLFTVQNSNTVFINELTISNCKITDSFALFQVLKATKVIIQNIVIENVTYISSSNQQTLWNSLFSIQYCDNVTILNIKVQNCVNESSTSIYPPFVIFLLQANKITSIQTFKSQSNKNIMLLDISQSYMQQGFGEFKVVDDTVSITDLNVSISTSIEGFAFLQIQSDNLLVSSSHFIDLTCKKSYGCAIDINQSTFQIIDGTFQQCTALKGGAISIRDSPNTNQIIDSVFELNSASMGGAIFIDSSNLSLSKTTIINNQAKIGGAIRYMNYIPDFIIQKMISLDNTFGNSIQNNVASVFGQNVGSYPRSLQLIGDSNLSLKQLDSTTNNNFYMLNNFMSGGTLQFSIILYDEEGSVINVNGIDETEEDVYKEISSYNLECISKSKQFLVSGSKALYQEQQKQFIFSDILLKATPSSTQIMIVENNMLQIPDLKTQKFIQVPQSIQISIKFRQCIRGEVYVKPSQDIPASCLPCPQEKYSLVEPNPDSKVDQVCKLCPEQGHFCIGGDIILKNGYWRESHFTDIIVECTNNKDNCRGEDKTVNDCKAGYVGPLCEQCDLKGKIWGQKYMNDGQFKCIPCENSQSLVAMYLFSVIFGSCYMLYGIRQAIQMTIIKIQGYYLRMMGLASIGNSDSTDQSDIYLKQLMHFVQISSIVYSVQLPSFFFMFEVSIGTPIDSIKYSQDCRSFIASDLIPPVYSRVIWSQLIPLGYMILLIIVYLVFYLTKQINQMKRGHLITGSIFMFLFMQPNIISGLVSIISCRSIGSKQYIQADVTLECYTNQHITFFTILFTPLFLIWAVIIPSIWIVNLFKNRKKLHYCTVRQKYGFLYQEYTAQSYYWEFVKINLKLLIIFISTFFNQQISIKSTLCTLVLFLYLLLSLFKSPYMCTSFNRCDQYMNIVLIACLQLNIFVQTAVDGPLAEIGKVSLFIINYSFMIYLIIKVLQGKLRNYLFLLSKPFPQLKKKCFYLYLKLDIVEKNKMRTFKNWSNAIKLIGQHLLKRNIDSQIEQVKEDQDETRQKEHKLSVPSSQIKFYQRKKSQYYSRVKQDTVLTERAYTDRILIPPTIFKEQTTENKELTDLEEFNEMASQGSPKLEDGCSSYNARSLMTSYKFNSKSNQLRHKASQFKND